MNALARGLAALTAASFAVFLAVAWLALHDWRRDAAAEINAEIASLQATSQLFPGIGALDPISRRAAVDSGFYLVADMDGQWIDGNILAVEQPIDLAADAPSSWRVMTRDGARSVFGRWVRIDAAMDILVARSPDSLWRFLIMVAAVFIASTTASGFIAWRFARRREVRDQERLSALATVFEAFARGESSERAPVDDSGEPLDRLAGTLNRSIDRINAFVQMFTFLNRFIWHDVMASVGRARQELERRGVEDETALGIARHLTASEAKCKGVMEVARYETGAAAEFVEVDLAGLAHTVAEEYAFEMENRDMRMVLTARPANAMGVPGACKLLVDNLVKNAVAYSPDGSEIELETGVSSDGAPFVRVRDRGPGLSAFPPNFDYCAGPSEAARGNVKTLAEGHGVGLILVYRIARFLGARITYSDRSHGGGLEAEVIFADNPT